MCRSILESLCLQIGNLSICVGHLSLFAIQARQCSRHIRDRSGVWILCPQMRFLIFHMERLHLHLQTHQLEATFSCIFHRAYHQLSGCSFLYEMGGWLSSRTCSLIQVLSRNVLRLQGFHRMVYVVSVTDQHLCVQLEIQAPFPN